jgi:hypothetical protein
MATTALDTSDLVTQNTIDPAIASSVSTSTTQEQNPSPAVNESEIAQRAYTLWQQRGCPDGCSEEDWFQAEQELRSR